jgi:hypothetical protein
LNNLLEKNFGVLKKVEFFRFFQKLISQYQSHFLEFFKF